MTYARRFVLVLVALGCLFASGAIALTTARTMDLKATLLANDEAARRAEASRAPPRRYAPPARDEGAALRERMVAEATAPDPSPVPTLRGGEWGVSDVYIVLDSWQKQRTSDIARGELAWNVVTGGASSPGALRVRAPIENVIELEVSPFQLPPLPEPVISAYFQPGMQYIGSPAIPPGDEPGPVPEIAPLGEELPEVGSAILAWFGYLNDTPGLRMYPYYPYAATPADFAAAVPPAYDTTPPTQGRLGWPFNPWSQTPHGLLALRVAELGEQSYKGATSQYHWLCELSYPRDRDLARLRASPQKERFVLTDPIRSLASVTLQLTSPDNPVALGLDVLYDTVTEHTSLAPYFYYPNHGLREDDRIFIRNWTAPPGANASGASFAALLNRPEGYMVHLPDDGHPLTNPRDHFELKPSPLVDDGTTYPGVRCDVYIARNRLLIPMRIRQLVPRQTQTVVPV